MTYSCKIVDLFAMSVMLAQTTARCSKIITDKTWYLILMLSFINLVRSKVLLTLQIISIANYQHASKIEFSET